MAAESIKLKASTRKETVSAMEMNRRGACGLPCFRGENIHAFKKTSVLTGKNALLMKELVQQINTTTLSHFRSALSNQRTDKRSLPIIHFTQNTKPFSFTFLSFEIHVRPCLHVGVKSGEKYVDKHVHLRGGLSRINFVIKIDDILCSFCSLSCDIAIDSSQTSSI